MYHQKIGNIWWLKIGNIINTHMTDQNSASSNESQMFFWKEIDVLKGNNNDRFGSDIAIHNNNILIGASQKNIAYVYEFGNQEPSTSLVASYNSSNSLFGASVAIYGNILVVGAPYESYNNLEKSGSVYIFEKDVSGNWNHLSRITNPTPNEYDYFGHSVSIYDDLIVVGSINSEDNYLQTNDAGHVYVYRNNSNLWMLESTLIPDNSENNDNFGFSVNIYENVIIVGAPYKNNKKGALYVFRYSDTIWYQEAMLVSSYNKENSYFGFSASIYGNTLVVGSYGQSRIEIFKYNENWNRIQIIHKDDNSHFGYSVTINNNFIGIGAPNGQIVTTIQEKGGLIYLYELSETNYTNSAIFTGSESNSFTFGASVAISENNLIISDPNGQNDNSQRPVYLFDYKLSF